MELLAIALIALSAGTIGTMLGLGGGVILVPILTLPIFDVPLKTAVAAGVVAVVANSTAGSGVYLRARFTNVRLALMILMGLTTGALIGSLLGVTLPEWVTKSAFALLLLYVAYAMSRPRGSAAAATAGLPDPMGVGGHYVDPANGRTMIYVPQNLKQGVPFSALGGLASGLFGIGGGPITVPIMNLVMNVPLKAATSTSSFMVGLTATASALVYYGHGEIDPRITIACVCGIVFGARIGARLAKKIQQAQLQRVFVVVMIMLAVSMGLQAVGVL